MLERHILPALGGMALSAVGRREIAALHHRLRDKPCTANAAVRVASSMFQRAEAWELVPPGRNPCRSVRRYKQHSRERFLTPEEYRCLGRALSEAEADGSVWPPAIAAIRLLMLAGCRHSEILTLRWDDVDRTAGELRLRDAKTGSRMVPMTAPVALVLDGTKRTPGNPWVIVGKTSGVRMSSVKHYWHRIRARAGLDDLRLHDCRHSYASRALALGESLPTMGALKNPVSGRGAYRAMWRAPPGGRFEACASDGRVSGPARRSGRPTWPIGRQEERPRAASD